MATPVRKLILDDIESTLKAIGTMPNAKTSPCVVQRVVKEWDTSGSHSRPWIGFRPSTSSFVYRPFGRVEVRLLVDIVAHVSGDDDDERADNLNDILDDIVAALQVDTRRGGHAIHTTITQSETDEGDPDTIDSAGGGGSVVLRAEVFYERTVSIS